MRFLWWDPHLFPCIFEPFRARRLEMTSFLVRYETHFTMIGWGFVLLCFSSQSRLSYYFSLIDPTRCDLSMSFFVSGIFRILFTTRQTWSSPLDSATPRVLFLCVEIPLKFLFLTFSLSESRDLRRLVMSVFWSSMRFCKSIMLASFTSTRLIMPASSACTDCVIFSPGEFRANYHSCYAIGYLFVFELLLKYLNLLTKDPNGTRTRSRSSCRVSDTTLRPLSRTRLAAKAWLWRNLIPVSHGRVVHRACVKSTSSIDTPIYGN